MQNGQITLMLQRIRQGDSRATSQLIRQLERLIRPWARTQLARERPGATYDAGDLVQTALLQLFRSGQFEKASSRGALLKGAALVIKHMLIDRARRRRTAELAGYVERVPADDVIDRMCAEQGMDLAAFDRALARLQQLNPLHYDIVVLRVFAGQTLPAIARTLDIPATTLQNCWDREIKPWLFAMVSDV